MASRVCIVGTGVVESPEPLVELAHKELLFYATRRALDDAGMEREDVRGAITASYDLVEGRGLSNQYTLDSIGGVMKPCDMRLGDDGMHALFAGAMEVMADPSEVVVVASVQKASERDPEGIGYQNLIAAAMEPVFSRPVCAAVPDIRGLDAVLAAMDARAFMERTGLSERELATVAAKNVRNAGAGGSGLHGDQEAVLDSPLLSWPIRAACRAQEVDAACALILASPERAKRTPRAPVFINGMGWCSEQNQLAFRPHGVARETQSAARQAYRMAGIRRPLDEIDVAEVSDWYAHRELMHCEALGFCGAADALGRCVADGVFVREGRLPVNLSGGLLGRGNAIGVSGLISVARVVLQLRGEAGVHQVRGVEVGLAHSWGGIVAPAAGVAVLGKG